ncbi:unnamed protein product [Heligmosomoides polygyrus]|uniref:receptor protein-tyrosine kinase n=1 Tax=Heligmosomoides polygyrus TaxID=6339 RepID=A0A183G712_HELPZ|nr:unnamed protein product [Heligmosomoides polygyrus]
MVFLCATEDVDFVANRPFVFHYNSRTPISKKITLLHPVAKAKWELTKDKITLVKKVGEGEYGEVWQGKLHEGPKTNIIVAVKMTKVVDENQAMVREMYEEARLMRQYKHKNVVAFYGVVQESLDNAMIVMEFIGGCLRDYIRRNKDHMSVKKKIHYASDIAVGLVYLHTKGCMHRDIACRNCLIDEKKQVVKISDFGMSKVADVYNIPKTEKIPIRWQAPEAVLLRIYTAKSDVFSYGITLWEIFHDAETPYKGIDNKTIRLKILNPTFRPQVNPNVPIVAVRVMKACWRANPKRRPTMAQAARYLIHSPKQL